MTRPERRWRQAKRVLLSPAGAAFSKSVPPLFTTVFWSPVWFQEVANGTMGILCDPKHPALARFPTDMHTDWQWHEPIGHSVTMVLDDLPATLRPIVQVVDNFTKNRRLGLVFEARVGKGRLLVSSIDLRDEPGRSARVSAVVGQPVGLHAERCLSAEGGPRRGGLVAVDVGVGRRR